MKLATLPLLLCVVMLLSGVSEGVRLCPLGWALIRGRCLKYVPYSLTWAQAERNCIFRGGNLVSFRNFAEFHAIQRYILRVSHRLGSTWIGGSDAAEERVWLWSDGKPMRYINWCPHEPNNHGGKEHCMEINPGGRCWNDLRCWFRRPSVCAKNRYRFWIQIGKKKLEK